MSWIKSLFGKPAPMVPDFEPLYAVVVPEIAKIVAQERAARPDDHVYAYALTNFPDLDGLGFHMNSEADHAADCAASKAIDDPAFAGRDMQSYFRWFWGEWRRGEYVGDQTRVMETATWIRGALGPLYKTDYRAARRAMEDAMEEILRRLDAAGTFGTGPQRAAALIYIGFYDDTAVREIEVMRALNPPEAQAKWGEGFISVFKGLDDS